MRSLAETTMFTIATVGVAALHFAVSFVSGFIAGISPSSEVRFERILFNILTFPLQFIPNTFELPGPLTWLPWIALSLCWGLGSCVLIRWIT